MSTGVIDGKVDAPMPSATTDTAASAPVTSAVPTGTARAKRSIAPAVLLVLGVGAGIGSWQLRLGSLQHPEPGLWPFATSLLVTLSALVLLIRPDPDPGEEWTRKSWSLGAGIGILAAFILLFGAVGFLIPAVLMVGVWLRAFGGESWRYTLILAIGGPAILYVIFNNLLGVPLPDDVLLRAFS